MKDQIAAKLSKISNLEDRSLLKNVLEEVFFNLWDHTEDMYQQLENRVFEEAMGLNNIYDIVTTAVGRDNYDPVHYYLRPMQSEDLIEKQYNLTSIMEETLGSDLYPVMTVFFDCHYRLLKLILNGQRSFQGSIFTEQGSIQASFSLRPDTRYLNQISALYETFIQNNLSWKTVNNPYIFRFAQVFLRQCNRPLHAGETVKEIIVDFAEYGAYVRYDVVPLWNVEKHELNSTGFSIPCEDKINYEHTIELDKLGAEHGYLAIADEQAFGYIRRTKKGLTIVAPYKERSNWKIIRIVKPIEGRTDKYEYPLLSNSKRQAFSDTIAQRSFRVIRTEAEIRRLVAAFTATEFLALSRIEIIPRSQSSEDNSDSYEMNTFIADEIRRSDWQNTLMLYFDAADKDNFLICDLISFAVSEVQLHYPDYKCEGKLL